MKDSANHNKTKVFRTSPLKSLRYGMAIIVFCLSATFGIQQVKAADYTVSSTGDDGGANTLRGAILAANANAGTDRILFSVSGTIMPATPLPIITDAVIIDGRPGGNLATAPTVELSGAMTTNSANATSNDQFGLQFAASAAGSTIRGLIINRFGNAGIKTAGNNTTILQNYIGTDAAGMSRSCGASPATVLCGNINQGILIVGSTGNVIGGADASDRNVISGNQGSGIAVMRGGAATIINNYIGVGVNGTADLGNTNDGILIADSSNSIIGGVTAAQRNVISGNNGNGVYVAKNSSATAASGNVIQGNYIGVNAAGAGDLTGGNSTVGNDGSGVVIEASGNTVGGNAAGARNIISGNRSNGVSVGTNFASANTVSANYIGVASDGTTLVRNRLNGVQITNLAFNNLIGGLDVSAGMCNNSCNLIANNGDANANSGRAGIYLDSSAATSNSLRGNSIFSNTGLGIDLAVPSASTDTTFVPGTGITPNDVGDPDRGPNDLQNFPVITAANTAFISGSLNSTPNTTFAIDFYSNTSADGDMSEGRTYIGSLSVTTDGAGNSGGFSFSVPSQTLTVGQIITATATSTAGMAQAIGDTSEFSQVSNSSTVAPAPPAGSFEADVAPRPSGNGSVDITDVQQVLRFQTGTDSNYQNNEFQRADSSPRTSSGDGVLDITDVQQALRYQSGADAPQPAGGPTTRKLSPMASLNGFELPIGKLAAPSATTVVKAVGGSGAGGQTVTVQILVDAQGTETGFGFSLNFNSQLLTFNSAVLGADAQNSFLQVNRNNAANGQIGIGIVRDTPVAAGSNKQILIVTFTIAAGAAAQTTPITFGNTPAQESVSDANAQPVAATFQDGAVTITRNAPTAASVGVGGRVTTTSGKGIRNVVITMTDGDGQIRTATTASFGYYRFDNVEVGQSYTFSIRAKHYSFTERTRLLSINDETNDIDFTGTAGK